MKDYRELLRYIDPDCDYNTWLQVGQALKHEGEPLSTWDEWSRQGTKYTGDCAKKWKSFNEKTATIVTGGTIYHLAQLGGYTPSSDAYALSWDSEIAGLDYKIIDPAFEREVLPKLNEKAYDPIADMRQYLELLFHEDEHVGYCSNLYLDKDGKWKPGGGVYSRTAGELIKALDRSINAAFGAGVNQGNGAYIRFNPLDGKGEGNTNVTRRTYCLIESDADSLDKQYSLLKAMNLPIRVLVNSGGKSLHAITHVDAANLQEYRDRVNFLYEFCQKNGLTVDIQDKNESRYSRLPGVKRGDRWQYIVATNLGAKNYNEWHEWADEQNDNLPEDISLADVWDALPALKEELISGVLRVGHKLLISGPSKAGKSFLLMNLAISIAEGVDWLGLSCKRGKVVYVNLELDSAECLHRMVEIYRRRKLSPEHIEDIRIWNLRGYAVPMNRLAPLLIRRFKENNIMAVIIDPIYKVITGDENNATEMSQFCSFFDKVATEMGVAMIYCHHHSKGASSKYSNAVDRASGSGVFARDPDAILDLAELNPDGRTEQYRKQNPEASDTLTAWEMTSTLRSFAPAPPLRMWFDYPVHFVDANNLLAETKYSNMGSRGVGREQTSTKDWFSIVEDLMNVALTGDTAVSIEDVGISKSHAKNVFTPKTRYAVVTTEHDEILVIERGADMFRYDGRTYRKNGKTKPWIEVTE